MDSFCLSCAVPLEMPQFKGPSENYCINCSDSKGHLKPKKEIQQGLSAWFKSWQPELNNEKALERARLYMKAMPAWAD